MKLRTLATTVALAVGSFCAHAVLLDFEGLPTGSVQPVGTFDAFGVHFDQALSICSQTCGDLPSSGTNTAMNFVIGQDITGFFFGAVNFVSVFAGDGVGDIDTVTLNGYDAADVLVDTATFTAALAQTLTISGPGITRFEILQVNAIAIDDFEFRRDAAAVPEPATALLLGLGALGIAASRRRRAG